MVHPWKLTWHWKIPIFNRKYIFVHGGFSISHVSFLGGMYISNKLVFRQMVFGKCYFGETNKLYMFNIFFCISPYFKKWYFGKPRNVSPVIRCHKNYCQRKTLVFWIYPRPSNGDMFNLLPMPLTSLYSGISNGTMTSNSDTWRSIRTGPPAKDIVLVVVTVTGWEVDTPCIEKWWLGTSVEFQRFVENCLERDAANPKKNVDKRCLYCNGLCAG